MNEQSSREKVYLLLRVNIAPQLVREFNEYWAREALPFWLKHGARHIGSFLNYAGGSTNEIIRLFEFDNISHWAQFEEIVAETEEGQDLRGRFASFNLIIERRLLRTIY